MKKFFSRSLCIFCHKQDYLKGKGKIAKKKNIPRADLTFAGAVYTSSYQQKKLGNVNDNHFPRFQWMASFKSSAECQIKKRETEKVEN